MSQRVEFRVVWKREGRRQTTRIYQSWDAAYKKAQGVLALDAIKHETQFHTMPDLEERPVIEKRQVGDWEPSGFDVPDPHEHTMDNMRFYLPSKREEAGANAPW